MRKSALAAGGAALAIALAGCGNGGDTGNSGDTGNDGDNSSDGAAQSLFSNTKDLAKKASTSTDDVETAKFSINVDLGEESIKGNGEGRFAGKDTAMALTMDMQGQERQTRMVDQDYYLKLPKQSRQQMGDGKPWVKMSSDGDNPLSQLMGQSFEQASNQADPTKLMDTMKQGGEITKKERTDDGSHYWVDVDPLEMMKQTYSSEMMEQMPDTLEKQLKDTTVPTQIWLNEDMLPTKITMDMAKLTEAMGQGQGGQGQQAGVPGKVVVKYHDWGEPVHIEKPPEDQVGEFEMPDIDDMKKDMPN